MTGKVLVITGGASGIGRATALAFAQQGACVRDRHVCSGSIETLSPQIYVAPVPIAQVFAL